MIVLRTVLLLLGLCASTASAQIDLGMIDYDGATNGQNTIQLPVVLDQGFTPECDLVRVSYTIAYSINPDGSSKSSEVALRIISTDGVVELQNAPLPDTSSTAGAEASGSVSSFFDLNVQSLAQPLMFSVYGKVDFDNELFRVIFGAGTFTGMFTYEVNNIPGSTCSTTSFNVAYDAATNGQNNVDLPIVLPPDFTPQECDVIQVDYTISYTIDPRFPFFGSSWTSEASFQIITSEGIVVEEQGPDLPGSGENGTPIKGSLTSSFVADEQSITDALIISVFDSFDDSNADGSFFGTFAYEVTKVVGATCSPSRSPSSMPSSQPSSMPSSQPTNLGVTNFEIDFADGFNCAGVELNEGRRAFPRLVENDNNDLCTLRLSPDRIGRAVSAFLPFRFNVETAYAFEVEFMYTISGIENGAADGIAFVIHQDPRRTQALGEGGGNLGVYGDNMISPALVVEFDTFFNRFGLPADSVERAIHVTLTENSEVFKLAEVPADNIRNTMTNMDPIKVNLVSDGDSLTVFLNDVFRVVVDVNLAEHFVGRDVFVGFTGGAGAFADQQDVLTWTMKSVVPDSPLSVFGARVAETRPPIPPTSPPAPAPTTAAPTTLGQRGQPFWMALIDILPVILATLANLTNG